MFQHIPRTVQHHHGLPTLGARMDCFTTSFTGLTRVSKHQIPRNKIRGHSQSPSRILNSFTAMSVSAHWAQKQSISSFLDKRHNLNICWIEDSGMTGTKVYPPFRALSVAVLCR